MSAADAAAGRSPGLGPAGAAADDLLVVRDLVKRFGDVTAVDGASFTIRRGEIFGLLGPNGAGKTTTINLLTGLARPTAGSRFLDGVEYGGQLKPAQARMGVVPDESNLYEDLDGFANLCFCASLYGMRKRERETRARRLLAQFGLEAAARRPFRAYSKGMKRKLTIAAGIIHEPGILFLDEPTTGIDVASARQIRQLVLDLNRRGTTILLTTHYIEEAERLCHRIAFIVAGKIVRIGTLDELMREHHGGTVLELAVDGRGGELARTVRERFPGCTVERADERSLRLVSSGPIELLPLLGALAERGATVSEARMVRPTLEEVFVKITGIESGAVLFGVLNALVPVAVAAAATDLSGILWLPLIGSVVLTAVTSTFLGLFIAVAVHEVFEAQTFSNFFRFPMLFLCGLFIPVASLPVFLRPLSFAIPLTYGADILKRAVNGDGMLPLWADFAVLAASAALLFGLTLYNIRRKWIL